MLVIRLLRCATALNCCPLCPVSSKASASAYPACRPEVELAGALFAEIAIDSAVTDGQYVTAPAWPAPPAWLSQFMALLGIKISP